MLTSVVSGQSSVGSCQLHKVQPDREKRSPGRPVPTQSGSSAFFRENRKRFARAAEERPAGGLSKAVACVDCVETWACVSDFRTSRRRECRRGRQSVRLVVTPSNADDCGVGAGNVGTQRVSGNRFILEFPGSPALTQRRRVAKVGKETKRSSAWQFAAPWRLCERPLILAQLWGSQMSKLQWLLYHRLHFP